MLVESEKSRGKKRVKQRTIQFLPKTTPVSPGASVAGLASQAFCLFIDFYNFLTRNTLWNAFKLSTHVSSRARVMFYFYYFFLHMGK